MSRARELFQQGELDQAIEAAVATIKAKPTDIAARSQFCELLCFRGDFERAEKQLDALSQLDASTMVGVGLFQHALRAAVCRKQVFAEGRVPEFVGEPPEYLQTYLRAGVELRAGADQVAFDLLQAAEQQRPHARGTLNGVPFNDLRDLDDLLAPVLEVFTVTGKYYWIPFDRLNSLELKPVVHLRDLLWRPASISVQDGPQGEVFVPVLYPSSETAQRCTLQTGKETDWIESPTGLVRGVGQRMWLAGEETTFALLEVQQVTVEQSTAS